METEFEMQVRMFLSRSPFGFRNVSKDNLSLFCTALTHDSFSNEMLNLNPPRHVESYERLEFLGDSILEFLVCEHVYTNTDLSEGAMTDFKQDKVANSKLSDRVLAYGLGIDELMRTGGGHSDRIEANMRSDCFEAILGAVYLSYGMDEARRVVHEVVFHYHADETASDCLTP